MSRSPHYGRYNTDHNEASVSLHRRFASYCHSSSTSPCNNHMLYKTQHRSGQDSNYSDRRYPRNSQRSCRDKDGDYRDRDRRCNRRRSREKNCDRRSNKAGRPKERDRSCKKTLINTNNDFDSGFYKNKPPNINIMIRGLAQHISESDIHQDITNCGLMPKDIRLIRKKDTGASRGFAFVEFTTMQEAKRWMEMKHGVLMFQDQYRATMQYTISKDTSQQPEAAADWFCNKCGGQNFKRRDNCFQCHASQTESKEGGSGIDEVCTYATKTILLRNLDTLTTENSIMTELKNVIPDMINLISGVLIGRDPLTSISRGICYLTFETTCDALTLSDALTSLDKPFTVDGKTAIISYCKYNMNNIKKAFSQMQFPTTSQPNFKKGNDLNSLAHYNANRYATTPSEYQQYFQYYTMYFAQQITLKPQNQIDSTNVVPALVQNAILQRINNDTIQLQIPNGIDGKKYPLPDVNKYHYDQNTGYFYDPSTGLYYDKNSQYHYNSMIQKYLYWDNQKYTYLLAPTRNESVIATPKTSQPSNTKKTKLEKQDRQKLAKKVAKDMERWAKNLNQKKETVKASIRESKIQTKNTFTASVDPGLTVLEKNNNTSPQSLNIFSGQQKTEIFTAKVQSTNLVTSYGDSSDTSGDEATDGIDCLDWNKLVCLLCERQFFSKEDLSRHKDISMLHENNLELRYFQKSSESGKTLKYRDKAKERRFKYGESYKSQPNSLKEINLKARKVPKSPEASASTSDPIESDNVGNRLLQKMEWTEGQGLGKNNQDRRTIVQAQEKLSTVGLDTNQATPTSLPSESYKNCVKKIMFARYQKLV